MMRSAQAGRSPLNRFTACNDQIVKKIRAVVAEGHFWEAFLMLRRIWLLLSLSLMSASAVLAQTAGQISGHVTDTTGAAVPKVAITLTSAATGAARSTFTTSAGDYEFPDVQPGTYTLQATHPDFKTDTAQL